MWMCARHNFIFPTTTTRQEELDSVTKDLRDKILKRLATDCWQVSRLGSRHGGGFPPFQRMGGSSSSGSRSPDEANVGVLASSDRPWLTDSYGKGGGGAPFLPMVRTRCPDRQTRIRTPRSLSRSRAASLSYSLYDRLCTPVGASHDSGRVTPFRLL